MFLSQPPHIADESFFIVGALGGIPLCHPRYAQRPTDASLGDLQ
jgi:hypothetical protein